MDIRREMLIATSMRRVWACLTEQRELEQWACEQAEVGNQTYRLSGSNVFTGSMGGSVTECHEGKVLRLEWELGGVKTNVEIRVDLVPQAGLPEADFTRVTVEHRNIPDDFSPSTQSTYVKESLDISWMMWLRRLALWAERAQVPGRFDYSAPLSAVVEQSVVVEANLDTVWRYLTDPERRNQWFHDPLGTEVNRVERNRVTYEWLQDATGLVTFQVEPMSNERTLVMVHHEGIGERVRFDYTLGWQDYLIALAQAAAVPVIRQTIWIAATPAHVWKWFTSEAAMRAWWNENTVYEPRVGGRISFSDHGADLFGIVTELVEPSRFAFTFVEAGTEGVRDPFVLTVDLSPEQDGTRVVLTQSGFDRLPDDVRDRLFGGFRRGWSDSPEIYRLAEVAVFSRLP